MNDIFFENPEYDIKIYRIDKTHFEFKKNELVNNNDIINHIVNKHKEKVNEVEESYRLHPIIINNIEYFTYSYTEEKESYWKDFIPESLSKLHDFSVKQISFVLFACAENNIYAIVGGGGSRVIIRYQDQRFGLDFFEYITDLDEEVLSIEFRGISGKLSKRKDIFKDGLKLIDVLNFTNIPSKINLKLKKEIKDSVFPFIDFGDRTTILEIGSYFNIKHKINFNELHSIFLTLNEISKSNYKKQLTSFVEIKDKTIIKDVYKKELIFVLFNYMNELFSPSRSDFPKHPEIEFVHPSNIQDFYESDMFIFKLKDNNKKFEFRDKEKLLYQGLKIIYENYENLDLMEFRRIISGLWIYGLRKNKILTRGVFLDHIICELNIENRPIFQIDTRWFKVEDNFTNSINELCNRMIEFNYLDQNILTEKWNFDLNEDEDSYNRKYHLKDNYWVFDKSLGQNIELCDILYESNNVLYFVHVKKGFDGKIRDLSNQIQVSAARFNNDVSSGGLKFVNEVINSYNRKKENSDKIIDKDIFINKLTNKNKRFEFVMAFKSDSKKIPAIKGNVHLVKSNIAKYSLIQCVREMNMLSFPIKIVEIP
ncbi:hypothetical protein GOQ30_03510 [Flavobacterium sp. TP390]|uniref:Sporadically distributed protein, TIGR04141 family n=1 Tax=Flavobacterium profundi TaxID=1774945 RepID=A0A6I4IJV0_9FLAO|nr:DUF6119 family protein [Flavobacterium profundi]MVO08231.1 hypothetical protein [Flavobacterium profundi]